MDYINIGLRSYTIILFISTLSFIAGSNVNCNGKAFHCVNSTHFKICVDLGGGVSTTVDEFLIPCPRNTVCKQYNLFECEYELTTTLPPVTAQNEVTNEQFQTSVNSVWEQLDITTIFPTKQQGMEFADNHYNKVNTTPANFTSSFDRSSSDVVIDPLLSSTTKDLNTSTNSNINKTLNISLRIDKELAVSITESEIDTAQTLGTVGTTLGTDVGVSSNYNNEISTPLDRKTIDSIKSISSKSLNQSSFDLNATLMVTERTNPVSGVSELPYLTTVKLLLGNLSDTYLQENISRKSNITNMIKSDNVSQELKLDPLIIYNKTPINKSDTQYRNTKNDKLNSNTRNDITDEKFINDESHKNSKVDNVMTLQLTPQNLAEATTSSYPTYLNTSDAIETFVNEGINITTNMEKLSVTDGDVISTSIIPKTSVVKTNKTSSQTTNFGLNVVVSNIALTNPILEVQTALPSNKSQSSEKKSSILTIANEILNLTNKFEDYWTENLNMENISLYFTTTEPYLIHERNDILPISSTLKSEITSEVNIGKVLYLSANEATQVRNGSQIDNLNYMEDELVSTKTSKNQSNPSFLPLSNISLYTVTPVTKTATYDKNTAGDYNFKGVDMMPVLTTTEILNEVTSLKPIPDLISKNETLPMPVIMTDLDNNNTTTADPSNNITAEISNGGTSLKPSSVLISKNETRQKPLMVTVATDLDNNNTTTADPSNNTTAEISNGGTSLKPSSVFISKNETRQKPLMVTVARDLNNNNTTTADPNNNITAEISNGVTSLKPSSVLISKNETIVVMDNTDHNNNDTTTADPNNNITAEISNGVTSLKPSSVLISKNETVVVIGNTDLDNNNTTTADPNNNIIAEISNGVTSLKPSSVLISKNETVVVMDNTDLNNNNTTTADPNNNITAEISNGVTSLKPSSVLISKNETVVVMDNRDLNNNDTTTADPSNNITAEIPNGVTSLKPSSVLISENETVVVIGNTDLNNNNTTTADPNNNITAEISNGVTSLKPSSVLISKNETVVVMDNRDLNNNDTTTADPSNNITAEIPNGVTSLKPSSVLISENETVVVIGNTDLNNNNTTTADPNNNITAEISNGVTSLKPSSILILNNEKVVVMGNKDLNNNNTTSVDPSNNITAEITNGVTSLKPSSVLISKIETVVVIGNTDLNNNNTTTADPNNNITAEIPNGVTSLKPSSVLILNNETVVVMDNTDLNNNDTTTADPSNNNITAEIPNGVTSLKPSSVLILNNETVVVMDNTDLNNNDTTTADPSNNNITAEIPNGVTSLKPSSVLILNNETVVVMDNTDLNNNDTTTADPSNNITAEISNGVTSLKPSSVLISKNETVVVMDNRDLNNNDTTTADPSNNITAEIPNGVTSLKPSSVLISENETVVVIGNTDLNNNNTTTADPNNNITAEISNGVTSLKPSSVLISKNETVVVMDNRDLNNNDTTTADPSNNITAEISNGATDLSKSNSVSHIISTTSIIQPTDFKLLMVTDTSDSFHKDNILVPTTALFTDHHTLNEAAPTLSSLTKIRDYIFMTKNLNTNLGGLISSIDSVTSNVKLNITSNTLGLPTTLDEPTTFLVRNLEVVDKNNTTYNNDITKPVHNSLSSNSNFINKISDVYETRIESYTASTTMESLKSTTAFKSAISMGVINNTFAVIDEVQDYTVKSDNLRSIDNTSKLESTITAKPSTFFVSNTSGKKSNSETKNVTIDPSESNKKEINKLRDNKNTSNNDEILDKNGAKNFNLTTPSTKHIIIPKLLTVITDFGMSPALSITNLGNNITNKNNTITDNSIIINNFKDIEVINKSSSVSSYSKSIPNSLTKPLLADMYKVSPRNFDANISLTRTLDKTTPSNKNNENKELSQIKQNEHAPIHAIRNIEHEGNKTEYLLLNPYKEVTTTAIDVNDSTRTLKEMSYNFLQPSSILRNNVKRIIFMENATMTSTDKNTTPKDFNDKEGSGFNKSYSTTNKLININDYKNRSELEISNNQPSGYVIKPLLIEQKTLVKISKSSLQNDNEILAVVTEHRLQGHVSDRINKSKISETSNVNRSEHIAPVKNITSSNWGVVNKRVVAKPTKTFTYDRNVSEAKGLSVPSTRDNYTHDLNATSDSSFTTNNLLRNRSSQTYSNNKTHQVLSNVFEFSRLPADKSKINTTPLVLKRPKLELISEPNKVTVSEQRRFINSNRSNGIKEKQPRNGHVHLESTTIGNGDTKNIENNAKSSFKTPIYDVNNSVTKCGNTPSKQEFTCPNRGKYSDANDCNKFYVCIGRIKPIVGVCPTGTVFSEYSKQCTKNITHCIRNNQFKCTAAGRFINILSNNTYFICAKKKSSFIRFTLKCQKGYYLDKYSVKCTPNLINISLSDENNSKNTKELSFHKEMEEISVKSKDVFECEKEGKFKDPQDCRKYYICKKGRRSTFRRKIKQCDSDEVFHRKKKKCVDVESYECDI